MATIYISSTFSDLEDCREAVYHALRERRHKVIAMEDYVAASQRPRDKCLADVAACDVYVGIFAWRYGYIPPTDNPEQKSITELEYRHAVEMGKHCLLFLLDEDAPWDDSKREQGIGAERIRKLREELCAEYMVDFFENCDQLALLARSAVKKCLARNRPTSQTDSSKMAPPKISTSRLPTTGRDLFGRERELEMLDEAWANTDSHVLSLVAWGGVGKSALVNSWLAQMPQDDYRGAERVYGWSFYSQGITDRAVSSDEFIEAALAWFGDPDPNKGTSWEKGERLAQIVGTHCNLLVLDGVEPLQSPPGPNEGCLKEQEQAMQALLRQLAADNKGLCIISTRLAVTDLNSFQGHTATRIDLESLSPEAGAEVLKAHGVRGTQTELEQAAKDFGGHSLTLALLGSYLSDVYSGDVSRRVEISDFEGDVRYGDAAQKVMASYEEWFGEGPELAVLRMLGLFNRPADREAIAAVRAAPAIAGLTDTLQGLSEPNWQRTLAKLRRASLLAAPNPDQPTQLDTHPLVREHFEQQLKRNSPDAWREGNNRLFEHLMHTTKEFPDTIEEMAPLYAAVAHGCEAGRHQEALVEGYWRRIQRRNEAFNKKTLGAFSSEIAALANFFDPPWLQPVATLDEHGKAFALSEAGYCLRAMGRMEDAARLMKASLEVRISQESWINAAITAINLSELHITIGNLPQALAYAERSVEVAKQSGDSYQQAQSRVALADALYQAGRLPEAESTFQQAEEIQRGRENDFPILYSVSGFKYCELLLSQGKYDEVKTRATHTLEWLKQVEEFLSPALDNLTLGRVYLVQAVLEATGDYTPAKDHMNQAIDGLRKAGDLAFLSFGLLARAKLYRISGDLKRARDDLDEAMSIAKRSGMRLHQADCHLEYAWLDLAQGEKEKARGAWVKAKEMIERMGYHRRDDSVQAIEEQLKEA